MLLVGCGGLQPVGVTQGAVPQGQMLQNPSRVSGVRQSPRSVHHASVTETVLYSFRGDPYDGANPKSGLTYFEGTLYGTTTTGGGVYCGTFLPGCGTVYSITPSGTETVLHSFTGGDGALPEARLIVLKGTLYGTTLQGGGGLHHGSCRQSGWKGAGTAFSITPSGQFTSVHVFTGSPDGAFPQAALLNVNGTMYGTTCAGGIHRGGDGTVFTITPSGDEHVIYSFRKLKGALPRDGRLVDLNGTLYGTASGGGEYGEGAVFSLSTSGREKLLHSFNGQGSSKDGANPQGGLTAIKHTLYGTTTMGGAYGDGTVFSITPTGTETVLHSFTGSDGSGPVATLLNVNGTLYGTTLYGGRYGVGTVFGITLSGHETVLHSFGSSVQDGAYPESGVIDVNGTLYGTTLYGGYGSGLASKGIVFSITLKRQ
jgi:uncharacterized repeat protein (TIGR03803 family)